MHATDNATNPAGSPPPTATPPLRIHHILLMMAVSAVALAVMPIKAFQPQWGIAATGSLMVWVLASATGITLLGIRWAWRRHGLRWLASPGIGGAAYAASEFLLSLPLWLIWAALIAKAEEKNSDYLTDQLSPLAEWWILWGNILMGILCFCLLVAVLIATTDTWRWRFAFGLIPISWAMSLLAGRLMLSLQPAITTGDTFNNGWYAFAYQSPSLIWIAAVVFACIGDVWKNRQRDWTHWLGLVVLVGPAIADVATSLFVIFAKAW